MRNIQSEIEAQRRLFPEAQLAVTAKHSANAGDAIYALAGLKAMCERQGRKAIFMQATNMKTQYYDGAEHPFGNLTMPDLMWGKLEPLIAHQPYIGGTEIFHGQSVHYDLDLIRSHTTCLPSGNIAKWYCYTFPDLEPRLWEPWIEAPDDPREDNALDGAILVNLTQRYRNNRNLIHYGFLQVDETCRKFPVFFVGTEDEYLDFRMQVPRAVYVRMSNILKLASAMKKIKVFIGNQSMCFAIAEAMKLPRVLEACWFAPNVDPCGPRGHMFYKQTALERYVIDILNGNDTV
jgi:hypothetical protein